MYKSSLSTTPSDGLESCTASRSGYDLVTLLYDGFLDRLQLAVQATERGDVLSKVHYIGKSLKILTEGLQTNLDMEAGGELAQNLDALYDYCGVRLILANAHNDPDLLREVYQLIEPLVGAWKQNRPIFSEETMHQEGSDNALSADTNLLDGFGNTRVVGASIYSSLVSQGYEMSQQLIDYYKAIEDSSRQMLDAAKLEDWDQVVRFEGVCAVLIGQLRERAHDETLKPEQRAEKTRIMQRILSNDAEIRYLAEPWLNHFEQNMVAPCRYLH